MAGTDDSTRVMLMDDEDIARKGMSLVLEEAEDIRVVAQSRVGRAALATAAQHRPDVILLGVRGESALRLIEDLADGRSGARILLMISTPTDHFMYGAISAGASGILLRDADAQELVYAVRKVADGFAVLDPAIASRLLDRLRSSAGVVENSHVAALDELSRREMEVLAGIAAARTNQEIARSIQVSLPTVKSHVSSILAKLGVRDRLGAALVARQAGIVVAVADRGPGGRRPDGLTSGKRLPPVRTARFVRPTVQSLRPGA